ncbi:MAG: hypothetical protein E7467_04600 [Ruminococcaceae bacterium]|nr:hypothetical protein [Oscillospiraceae bacterium]
MRVGAFQNCPLLSSVVLPEGFVEMDDEVFCDCVGLTEATIGGELERIGTSAFADCTALSSVTIRNGTRVVGSLAFLGCEALTSVTLPDTIEEIEGYAFVSCTSLQSIELGNSLQRLEGSALKNTALTEVTLPESLVYVGNAALGKNEALASVYFKGDAPEFQRNAFENTTTFAYYPSDRSGWTADVLQNYGGEVAWVSYLPSRAASTRPAMRNVTTVHSGQITDLANSTRYLLVVAYSDQEPLLARENLIFLDQYLSNYEGMVEADIPYVEDAYVALYSKHGVTVLHRPSNDVPPDPPSPPLPGEGCDGGMNCPSNVFVDVDPTQWYHDGIDFALTNGLFNGMSNTTFEPGTSMTRAMLVTVLWRYAGEPIEGENQFVDVDDDKWYTEAVTWASHNGVVNGVGNGRFDPDGKITREQMATILYRYAQSIGEDVSMQTDLGAFPDAGRVADYARDAISWAVAEGIIGGTQINGKTYLDPSGNATRAQVAVILMRFIK